MSENTPGCQVKEVNTQVATTTTPLSEQSKTDKRLTTLNENLAKIHESIAALIIKTDENQKAIEDVKHN